MNTLFQSNQSQARTFNYAKNITRKDFLRRSMGIAIGASCFPWIARSNPLAANGRVRTAVIGCGIISRGLHQRAMQHPLMEVVALCDVKSDMLNGAMQRQGGSSVRAYLDYMEVMARDDIDAVIVSTPDHWHAAMAIDAMRSGKDVYVEKPIALTIHEAAAIEVAEKRYGRILQVGSQQRSNDRFRRAAEIVRNGWIGNIREVHCRLGEFPPETELPEQTIPDTIDYDRWLGQAPWRPFNETRVLGSFGGGWRIFWDYGSRKSGDWGAHHYDIVQWALGRDDSGPTRFYPKGYQGIPHEYFEYADGIKVYRDSPRTRDAMIVFVGDEGEVRVGRGNFLETTPSHLASRPLSSRDILLYDSNDHFQNWIECMQTRRKPICPAAIGRRTFDICALAGIAERLERPLTWDPQKAVIVGDPEAWAFSDYPRREGFPLPS
jgi:predicted dehydrogenase